MGAALVARNNLSTGPLQNVFGAGKWLKKDKKKKQKQINKVKKSDALRRRYCADKNVRDRGATAAETYTLARALKLVVVVGGENDL